MPGRMPEERIIMCNEVTHFTRVLQILQRYLSAAFETILRGVTFQGKE